MNDSRNTLASTFPLGLIPAVHTPIDDRGELNLDAVEGQAELLLSRNVAGVFIAGTTGECHSLTVVQRKLLVQRWAEVARGSALRVIVHVGHTCQRDACQLAVHAAECNAHAIAAMAPFYFKPESVDELIEFLAPIAAATELPFYFYDIPVFTGVRLEMTQFLEHGKRRMPNLAGLKFTNPDLLQMQVCVQLNDGAFDVLHGFDETLLAGVSMGARGAVGNTYNFATTLYHQLLAAWAGGNILEARKLQAKSAHMILTLQEFGFQAAAKCAMELAGVDCGPPLPPLRPLSSGSKRELFRRLETLDVIG